MRHRKKNVKLGRKKQPREAMLKNLASSFILYEKVKTTKAKAKAVQPIVEKLITMSKENNLTVRRRLMQALPVKSSVEKCLEVLGPRYKERKSGYTRIIKLATPRVGDGAEMVQIEFVE